MKPRTIERLEDIPNVGKATVGDFTVLGIRRPAELIGKDPWKLYARLCEKTGQRHDPCVIDVLISAVRYMEGAPARPWWFYTPERKRAMAARKP